MNAASVIGIAWVALVAACAAADRGTDFGTAAGAGEDVAHVIAAVPGTHVLRLDDDTRVCLVRRLQRGDLDTARLTLVDLRPRAARALKGVRVFVEKTDADASTSPDDIHDAGAFVLGLEPRETVVLNIAPTLNALQAAGALDPQALATGGLRLTFVAEPWDFAAALPADFALPFARATLVVSCAETDPDRPTGTSP
jgi:hypothetical protein